ncbi:hypothetical protein DXB18_14470 [Clostridium sp. OM02-18AC]|uniref:hypothetical protein n=1 Tax=Clostridium sp. OM02-18AC TaxID=2292311 RepID=UPI000E4AFFFE|nr:hypothetical protein [Clostridium sp. OM02-18AC]RHV63083.1 hypothetical protein DXB18_14470 [Clostridium sp. OM02-18AC]
MIPKKLKYTMTITLLALATACLATGCKKKHDKIDLSGSQAAESTVQTAPAATTASEENSSENQTAQEITIEPAIEHAAGQSQGTSAGGSATASSLSVKTETYQNGNVSIQYPVISDSSVNAEINAHLKENALSILKAYEIDETKDTVTITCKILSATKNRITVRYEGDCAGPDSMHPTAVFYTNTVNLSSGADIGLSKLVDPSTLAAYVLSDDCTFPEADAEIAAAAKEFLASMDQAYYTDLFQHADFPYSGTFPECFSYEFEGSVYVSLPVAHAIGDYILAVYTPENK